MSLKEHYARLYSDSLQEIKAGNYLIDELIDSPSDNRFGITLLIRPDEHVKREMQHFLDKMRAVEPQQYFYPASDMHVTVMSIISCYAGFELSQVSVEKYVEVIQHCIAGFSNFEIEFRGVTMSPSCVMVQGFPASNTLNLLRDGLRNGFRNSSLQQSIDRRYEIQTAHATICRLRKELNSKTKYLKLIEAYRDHYFGTTTVERLELVFNDWYQRKELVQELHSFKMQ